VKLIKNILHHTHFSVNALAFLPANRTEDSPVALATHGYTSCKKDCLPWAQRLSENGWAVVIFDQPGHFLGSFHDLNSFEDYKHHGHELFDLALKWIKTFIPKPKKLAHLGHSLGALMALKALELPAHQEAVAVLVGFGNTTNTDKHIFESAFYQKTLIIREQLVSEHLPSSVVFSWIRQEKDLLSTQGKTVHLICGKDDVVVGNGGAELMKLQLEKLGNRVTLEEPNKLPHHEPGLAASFIYHYLKRII
jgi:hypothetical protein